MRFNILHRVRKMFQRCMNGVVNDMLRDLDGRDEMGCTVYVDMAAHSGSCQ